MVSLNELLWCGHMDITLRTEKTENSGVGCTSFHGKIEVLHSNVRMFEQEAVLREGAFACRLSSKE